MENESGRKARDGLPCDDGGHGLGAVFDGPTELINYDPQNNIVNRAGGDYYKLERIWEENLKNNKRVRVEIKKIFPEDQPDSNRPVKYEIKYWINDTPQTNPENGNSHIFEVENPPCIN